MHQREAQEIQPQPLIRIVRALVILREPDTPDSIAVVHCANRCTAGITASQNFAAQPPDTTRYNPGKL
jgi:hypothetical protein